MYCCIEKLMSQLENMHEHYVCDMCKLTMGVKILMVLSQIL